MINREELKNKINVKENNGGYVYVVLADDKTVKIGITTNPYKRISQIETSSGKEIIRWHFSDVCSNYKEIEILMHKYFKSNRLKGEWFNISYDNAVDYLKSLKFESVVLKDKTKEIITQFKTIQLCNMFVSMEHKEYNYKKIKYNQDIDCNRHIKKETLEYVKNMIFEHYENNREDNISDDYNYIKEYVDYIKNDNITRAVIEYCVDYMFWIPDEEILRDEVLYEVFYDVLKFEVIEGNYLAEDVCKNMLEEMYFEYGKDFVNTVISENF